MSDHMLEALGYGAAFTCFEWILLHIYYFIKNIRQKNNPPHTPNLDKPILLLCVFNIVSLYILPAEYKQTYLFVVIALFVLVEVSLMILVNGSILVNLTVVIKDGLGSIFKRLHETEQEKEERLRNAKSPYVPPTEVIYNDTNKDAVLLGKDSNHLCLWYIIPNTIRLEFYDNVYEGSATIKTVYLNSNTTLETEKWRYYVLGNIVKIFYKNKDNWREILVYDRKTGELRRNIASFWLIAGEWIWKIKTGYEFRLIDDTIKDEINKELTKK